MNYQLKYVCLCFAVVIFLIFSKVGQCDSFHKTNNKIRLLPLSQHVNAAVSNKLQSIMPTFRAQVWSQLQVVTRELKEDLRKILLLLEEHTGVSQPQTIEAEENSVYKSDSTSTTETSYQVTDENVEMKSTVDNQTLELFATFHKNFTAALLDLQSQLDKALSFVSDTCEKNIQENNNLILSQQGGILRSLEIINDKLDSLNYCSRTKDMETGTNTVRFG